MKLLTLLAAATCSTAIIAQTTVTTAPGNAQQTFYSLENGVVGSVALADWDLAFEITGFTASVLANTAKGMQVYKAPYSVAQWGSLDTNGMSTGWTKAFNSETDWSAGAFNNGLTENEFDLGWGVYNFVTHTVVGDSLFVIKLADGSWKKFRIDGLATSTYGFTWADVNGANEGSASLNKGSYMGKNFGYFSFATGNTLDPEPPSADWDLLFTKYTSVIPSPAPTPYSVAGVLQNKNIDALQIDGVDPALADWTSAPFDTTINIIGYDWKTFNMTTFQYEYAQDRTYFVKDQAGNVWKLVFTGYGGAATGDMTFTQELVSATSVNDHSASSGRRIVVYPNPVTSGTATLVIDATVSVATMSIHDLSGKLVVQERLTGLNGLVQRNVDVSALPAGLYMLRLQGDGVNSTSRLVIE
ncbi:MAG: T9SS type A sorting domain-containing protein [Flavobacteriales bacterium]|nr:T9SS type A sorting domain-containing protein [Flavobacteriales bacterium]